MSEKDPKFFEESPIATGAIIIIVCLIGAVGLFGEFFPGDAESTDAGPTEKVPDKAIKPDDLLPPWVALKLVLGTLPFIVKSFLAKFLTFKLLGGSQKNPQLAGLSN